MSSSSPFQNFRSMIALNINLHQLSLTQPLPLRFDSLGNSPSSVPWLTAGRMSRLQTLSVFASSLRAALRSLHCSMCLCVVSNSKQLQPRSRSRWLLSCIAGANQLTGTIPNSVLPNSALQLLSAPDNRLTGSIPFSLGNATQLVNLDLSDNMLTGTISPTLAGAPDLMNLVLMGNQLEGGSTALSSAFLL